MSATISSPQPQSQAPNASPRRPRHRRPRQTPVDGQPPVQTQGESHQTPPNSRRGGRAQPARDALLAMRPASVAPPRQTPSQPQSAEPSSAEVSAAESPRPGRGGRRRGGHGARHEGDTPRSDGTRAQYQGHSGQQVNTSRTFQGRQFGGQLTVDGTEAGGISGLSTAAASQLSGEAAEFHPSQSNQRTTPRPPRERQPQPRRRRPSKSTAPDITTRIHEDIDNQQYECAICTNEVMRNSKAWSCRTCWTVFHLHCMKKWASNEGSAMAQQQAPNGEMPPPRQWRCPGCNLPKDTIPSVFTCWCEKEVDPRPLAGIPPFSCGQTCSRPHVLPKKCPHPCPVMCHAGPCPPCPQMGPTQSCFCGKEAATRRCIDTDYENGWSCGQVCGELMPCGEHFCERPCHEGLCGACEVRIPARCYCGQVEKDILCCDRNDEKNSKRIHRTDDGNIIMEEWMGLFECENICSREFDCGKHHCEKNCHPQDAEPAHCPRSPDVVTHCPCGKTSLEEISNAARKNCEDPIPNCRKPCMKSLSCGHRCRQVCHSGECMPCLETVSITCRCGRTTSTTVCHQGTEEPPQCMRICRVTLNCGRHECGEHCCAGERKAAERQASRRKPRPLHAGPRPADDGFESEHICTRPCGRLLKCGNHTCQELCHKGPCGSCREAIFDEISCNCGRTVLQPPLPCGTQPPPCRFDCERPKACGHPQVLHNCHQDSEDCPRCPFLTVKPCMCGKNLLKNQQCWLTDVRCGEVCGKKLKCGAHKCRKPCHKPGECEDAAKPCQQACGKEKSCGHPCSDPCHSPYPCKEDKPCQHKIFITCDCQHIRQEAKCNATRDSEGNSTKSLKCDDECARLERNRRLALALNIDPETHKDDHVPYSSETLNMFLQNVPWAQVQEREFRVFAASPEEKRLRFKPMPAPQRAFLHALAEDFGFDSESMDPEPHRHVALFKSPRFVMAPMKTLAECTRIRHAQRVASTTSATAAPEKKVKASNVIGEPYNGFLMTNAKFGLTIEELRSAIRPALSAATASGIAFDISFQPDESVVFKAAASSPAPSMSERDLEAALQSLKPAIAAAIKAQSLGSLQLCRLDASLNVLRRESDSASNGGWSQVAAKAAAPKRTLLQPAVRPTNAFTVLGSGKVQLGKKKVEKMKKREEDVVEDWEAAESAEEEKEKAAGSAAGSVASEDEMGEERWGSDGDVAASGEEKAQDVEGGEAGKQVEEAA